MDKVPLSRQAAAVDTVINIMRSCGARKLNMREPEFQHEIRELLTVSATLHLQSRHESALRAFLRDQEAAGK